MKLHRSFALIFVLTICAADIYAAECRQNTNWDSRVFLMRIGDNDKAGVFLSMDSCESHEDGKEERWFSGAAHSIGFAVLSQAGSDRVSASFFQLKEGKLCLSAGIGEFAARDFYGKNFKKSGVRFRDLCGGSDLQNSVELVPYVPAANY